METSYTTHALEDIDEMLSVARTGEDDLDIKTLMVLKYSLINGQKFRVPDYGKLFDVDMNSGKLVQNYCQPFRLPYPITIIEYRHPVCKESGVGVVPFDASIVCAIEDIEKNAILVSGLYRTSIFGRRRWIPINFTAGVDSSGNIYTKAATRAGEDWSQKTGLTDEERYGIADIKNELSSVLILMAALACSNVQTEVVVPPEKLNKKRTKSGKHPFFSYKVLTIGGKAMSARSVTSGVEHSSPRAHLRRGHIRRLESKTVWVNSCSVGNARVGVVEKTYSINPESFGRAAKVVV